MNTTRSSELFREAQQHMPGGVNSPVRAFKSVGRDPLFISRAKGSKIYDADGNEYIDYIGSWGPMILGHADERVINAIKSAAEESTSFGASSEKEIELAKLVKKFVPVGRTRANREFRHRGDDERDAPRTRIHGPGQDHKVRGLLSRSRRFIFEQGRFRRCDARLARQSRRHEVDRKRHTQCSI